MARVDLRTVTFTIPLQEVITRDNVPARVNAVAYFRVVDAARSIVEVESFAVATSQIAQTTLRSVLGRADQSSTIVFPLPMDLVRPLLDAAGGLGANGDGSKLSARG